MSQAKTIQFKSIENIIAWYGEDDNLIEWTIAYGKEPPVFQYRGEDKTEGTEKLRTNLVAMYNDRSAAIYTIRLHEGDEIILSCNFRLHDHSELYVPGMIGGATANNEIISMLKAQEKQMEAISKRLNDLEGEDEDDEDEDTGQLGAIGKVLENPFVQGFLSKLFDTGLNQQQQKPAAISGVFDSDTQDQKISKAISILKQHDEKLGDHLLKLASIAQNNPTKFKSLISTLILL